MNLSQIIRRKVFWSFDILKRNDIKNHYTDIKNILDQPNSDISRIKREEYLRQILTHAVSTTSFYKKYSDHNSILDFPIINKNMIRDNFDSFKSSNFTIEDCVVISTSGSTGAPFSILQNKNKKSRNTGDTLYFSKKSGYDIGYKLVYLKIWPDNFKTKFLSKLWWQNIVPKSVFKLSDGGIEEFIKELEKDSSKKSLIGYASSFATICKYLDEIKASPSITNVQSIITISEGLNDYVRDRVNTYFGVTPMSRYSNSENGILAQEEASKKSKFIINSASYYIEIFDMDIDTPVAHGNSGRIVIAILSYFL